METLRGHEIKLHNGRYVYANTSDPTAGNRRSCGHCGLADTVDGHDGCLSNLLGVVNACCGHGDHRDAYVVFGGGLRIAGYRAIVIMRTMRCAAPFLIRWAGRQ